jgi:hypothetical protein
MINKYQMPKRVRMSDSARHCERPQGAWQSIVLVIGVLVIRYCFGFRGYDSWFPFQRLLRRCAPRNDKEKKEDSRHDKERDVVAVTQSPQHSEGEAPQSPASTTLYTIEILPSPCCPSQ